MHQNRCKKLFWLCNYVGEKINLKGVGGRRGWSKCTRYTPVFRSSAWWTTRASWGRRRAGGNLASIKATFYRWFYYIRLKKNSYNFFAKFVFLAILRHFRTIDFLLSCTDMWISKYLNMHAYTSSRDLLTYQYLSEPDKCFLLWGKIHRAENPVYRV